MHLGSCCAVLDTPFPPPVTTPQHSPAVSHSVTAPFPVASFLLCPRPPPGAIVASLGSFTYVSIIMGSLLFITGFMVMGMRWYYPRRQRYVAGVLGRPSPTPGAGDTPEGNDGDPLRGSSKSATAMLDHRKPSSTQEARLAAAAHAVVANSSSGGIRGVHADAV